MPLTDRDGDADREDGPDVAFLHGRNGLNRHALTVTAVDGPTGETLQLPKTAENPTRTFGAVDELGGLARPHSELDVNAPFQLLGLHVTGPCGRLSRDEYPPVP